MKVIVEPKQQQTPYSCVASVLQMLSRYYDGFPMTHAQAITLTRCEPEGAPLECVGEILQRKLRKLRTFAQVREALKWGHPVVANDCLTYVDDHAILITGFSKLGFYFIDPGTGCEKWKHVNWFAEATQEMLIFPYRTDTKPCKTRL